MAHNRCYYYVLLLLSSTSLLLSPSSYYSTSRRSPRTRNTLTRDLRTYPASPVYFILIAIIITKINKQSHCDPAPLIILSESSAAVNTGGEVGAVESRCGSTVEFPTPTFSPPYYPEKPPLAEAATQYRSNPVGCATL